MVWMVLRFERSLQFWSQGDSSAAEHAKRAIALGVSKEKAGEMNAFIAQFNE